jgi:hypothetical protein
MKRLFFCIFNLSLVTCCHSQSVTDSTEIYFKLTQDTTLSEQKRLEYSRKLFKAQMAIFEIGRPKYKRLDLKALKKKQADINRQTDSLYQVLSAFVRDTAGEPNDKQKALSLLADMNTYKADSFLVACMEDLTQLGDFPSDSNAGNDEPYDYPCFYWVAKKSVENYSLLEPILANLNVLRDKEKLYFYSLLIDAVFWSDDMMEIWFKQFKNMPRYSLETPPLEVNMKIIRELILERRKKK